MLNQIMVQRPSNFTSFVALAMADADLSRLRTFVAALRRRDGIDYQPPAPTTGPGLDPAAADLEAAGRTEAAGLEAIIRMARPVLGIASDVVQPIDRIVPLDDSARRMADEVARHAGQLTPLMRSVGRIELTGNDDYAWAGTGWLIASEIGSDIIVTNAHVAETFADTSATGGLVFRERTDGTPGRQSARIDFREEMTPSPPREFQITEVLYVSRTQGLDIAFLRASRAARQDMLGPPLILSEIVPPTTALVAAVGYPGFSSSDHDAETLRRVFRDVHEKKRISPGRVVSLEARGISHDCSTLPGSSGSALVDVASGRAIGLHYRGRAFESNHAVPAADILRVVRDRPWQGSQSMRRDGGGDGSMPPRDRSSTPVAVTPAEGIIRLTIPLEITIRVGSPLPAVGVAATTAVDQPRPQTKSNAEEAAMAARQQAHRLESVIAITAGRTFRDGAITDDYGVIVKVRPDAPRTHAAYGLPESIGGIPVVIESASIDAILRRDFLGGAEEAPLPARFGYARDLSKPDLKLDPIPERMKIILHVSPEQGWEQLSALIGRDDYDRMTIGMYHMSAPHVLDALKSAAERNGRRLTLTIDRKKGDDIGGEGPKKDDRPEAETLATWTEELGDGFRFTPASISGGHKLFHSAYHIKVLVLSDAGRGDRMTDRALWLSSGNWQSSNQPNLEDKTVDKLTFADVKDYNREWHAIVESERLAKVFRRHLEEDFKDNAAATGVEAPEEPGPLVLVPEQMFDLDIEAPRRFKAFPPCVIEPDDPDVPTVTPVLTPDNYAAVVTRFILGARKSVLFENQSFSLSEDEDNLPEHFRELAEALLRQQQNGLDVRIIFRSGFGKERDTIRKLVEFGFKPASVRHFDKVHTKGIVVDGKAVLLGSQNWTGAGTGPNRDASLLIEHPKAGAYFAELFEYDWRQMARARVREDLESMPPIRVLRDRLEAGVPQGYRVLTFSEAMDL
jgi:hypothetical protein